MKPDLVLKFAAQNIVSDSFLENKWIDTSTLEATIRARYDFGKHFDFSGNLLSRKMKQLFGDIFNLKSKKLFLKYYYS